MEPTSTTMTTPCATHYTGPCITTVRRLLCFCLKRGRGSSHGLGFKRTLCQPHSQGIHSHRTLSIVRSLRRLFINFPRNQVVSEVMYLARTEPPSLLIQARSALRRAMTRASEGTSVYRLVDSMKGVTNDVKGLIVMERRESPSQMVSARLAACSKAKKKLIKMCNETKV